MQVVILSGGAGKRLWPLSNTSRSKQFLKLLKSPSGEPESMVQRVVRQIRETRLSEEITIATFESQKDHVISQFGSSIDMITEPSRKGTFPAIALASLYFKTQKRLPEDEVIAVIPCDVYAHDVYFESIKLMAEKVRNDVADIYLMGVKPKSPSPFFGYIIPKKDTTAQVEFIEKPDRSLAQKLIEDGAYWNAGVFVFKLKFIEKFLQEHHYQLDFAKFVSQYDKLPKSSFDTTVIERTRRVGFLLYEGEWHDLGNWDALTQQIPQAVLGNVVQQNCKNTYIINELNIPLICHGTQELIVAASPDGILVADKSTSVGIKDSVASLNARPMYEERRWGTYKVIDNIEFADGFCALTKQLTLNPGCSISYQRHTFRDEIWTFIDGEGTIVIDDEIKTVHRGDVIVINRGQKHALKARTSLTFIEVQKGSNLVEEDIERFDYNWNTQT